MNTLILPQIAFAANYEEEIKSIIFNAMDCKLQSNRRFNHETRWFKDFPEFILTASPSWSDNSQTPVTVFHNYVEGGRLVSEKCETNKHDLPKLLERHSWQDQYYTLEPEGKLK